MLAPTIFSGISPLGMCITQGLDRIMAGIDTLLLFRQHRPHLLAKLIFL